LFSESLSPTAPSPESLPESELSELDSLLTLESLLLLVSELESSDADDELEDLES
jgi:hypothetical protein